MDIRNLAIVIMFLSLSFNLYAETAYVTAQASYREVIITGFTRARSTMKLASEVSGKIKEVFADIGETLPEKGKFACLDDTFIEIDIELARNDEAQRAVEVQFFNKQVSRHRKLVSKKSASVSELDDLKRQLKNAQKQLISAKLKRQRLEENRLRHCIDAPFGWRVIERDIEPGQWINAGETIGLIGDYYRLLIPLTLSAAELTVLKNMPAEIELLLIDYNLPIVAKIERISPAFDEHSRKIRVDLVVEGDLPDYRGGMRVELTVKLPDEFGAFDVPRKALRMRYEEVMLQRKDGEFISVALLGYQKNGMAKVSSENIKAGDMFKIIQP